MAFLRNRTINLVNLHYGIQALAMGMGGVFFLVILLRAGLSASVVLCIAAVAVGHLAAAQEQAYWLERWHVDLNALMRKPGAAQFRAGLRAVRYVGRFFRRVKRRLGS